MPRIKVMLSLLVFASGPAWAAPLPACSGQQLRGFNVYELMEESGIVEKFSVFEITDWSDASAFQGVVVPAGKNLSLDVELMRNDEIRLRASFPFAPWEKDGSLAVAEGFEANKFFKNAEPGMIFKLRLKEGGHAICEETKKIGAED